MVSLTGRDQNDQLISQNGPARSIVHFFAKMLVGGWKSMFIWLYIFISLFRRSAWFLHLQIKQSTISSSSLQWHINEEILFIFCIWLLSFLLPLSTWVTWWWMQTFLRTVASLMVGKKSPVVLFCSLCVHSSFQFFF